MTDRLTTALNLVLDKLTHWGETLLTMLPNTLVAVLVVFFFWRSSRLVRRGLNRGLGHVMANQQVAGLMATIATLGVRIAGIFIALSIMHLDKAVTSLLAGVGIVGLALGFAFQDLAANFVSGVLMTARKPFRIGDLVQIGDDLGVVEAIDLRTTSMRQFDGQLMIIPNRRVYENTLVNYARTDARRVEVAVGVAYDADLDTVRAVAADALEGIKCRDASRPVSVLFTGFGDSAIDLVCRFWILPLDQAAWARARSMAIQAIKQAFDTADIEIPFPIRQLDLPDDALVELHARQAA